MINSQFLVINDPSIPSQIEDAGNEMSDVGEKSVLQGSR